MIIAAMVKDAGLGPYFHAVRWTDALVRDVENPPQNVSVFSFRVDADAYAGRLKENGHTVHAVDLACDHTRRVVHENGAAFVHAPMGNETYHLTFGDTGDA